MDSLNRVTAADALLNVSLMPTEERESIANVTPTGWKNKKIKSGYLFNRSHLIGFALAGENDNWKNLMTGTRQLNSPEMLRFEMDVKTYLEADSQRYVRYQVTPIFRGDELLARGVHLMAQSVTDNSLAFNVYIFNIQDGVELNYADGSSTISAAAVTTPPSAPVETPVPAAATGEMVYVTPTGKRYHTHPHGNGTFTQATLEEALSQGLTPCQTCY
ncbi:DNA/RNA non-specific endonuclease [Enterococcus timonensis]|uniref:DNA/RNA non-specific endonuclease n=1 Tax=Enterococcus timonensis TaxID=1852364 RepID=UPI0008DA0A07